VALLTLLACAAPPPATAEEDALELAPEHAHVDDRRFTVAGRLRRRLPDAVTALPPSVLAAGLAVAATLPVALALDVVAVLMTVFQYTACACSYGFLGFICLPGGCVTELFLLVGLPSLVLMLASGWASSRLTVRRVPWWASLVVATVPAVTLMFLTLLSASLMVLGGTIWVANSPGFGAGGYGLAYFYAFLVGLVFIKGFLTAAMVVAQPVAMGLVALLTIYGVTSEEKDPLESVYRDLDKLALFFF